MDLDPESVARNAAGALGAVSAALLLKGERWTTIVATLVGGVSIAYYATPVVAAFAGTPEGLTGYLLGLFGMAAGVKLMDAFKKVDLAPIVEWLLKRFQ